MTITKDDYGEEVTNQAAYLVEAVNETGEAPVEAVMDTLYGHDWFARKHHGPALHGAIIEHSNADVWQYRDLDSYVAGHDDPAQIVENLAYACFEADVIESAQAALDGGDR